MKKGSAFSKKNPMLVILDYIVIRDTVCITCSHYKVRHREEVDRRDRHMRLKWTEIMILYDG
jgi:hypothetical protein